MCGIVGCAGDLNMSHEKLMKTLLILDTIRGEDSTGIAAVQKYGEQVKVAKQVGDPFQLFDHKSYDKVFSGFQRAIIGHNRYATVGVVNRNNAHPFENESVVGVHNGTLRTKHLLADAANYTVDSENIYHHIHKFGLQDALKYMGGAWALVWWDKDESTINFLRNDERPLWFCHSEDQKAIFWASEPWMLSVALGKHNIKYDEIAQFKKDTHISIEIAKDGKMSKAHLKAAPSKYTFPPAPPAQNYMGSHQNRNLNVPVNAPNRTPLAAAAAQTSTVPPTKIASNILQLPGKKEGTAQATPKKLEGNLQEPCDRSYLCAKGILFETMQAAQDDHGAHYIPCFDPLRPYYEVRLHARAGDPVWDMIGCEIKGNISAYIPGALPHKGYYKIGPDSITVLVPDSPADAPEETMVGPTGRIITESQFNKEYPSCSWCTTPLDFTDRNRFSLTNECFCPSCASNSDVLEAVNF